MHINVYTLTVDKSGTRVSETITLITNRLVTFLIGASPVNSQRPQNTFMQTLLILLFNYTFKSTEIGRPQEMKYLACPSNE
ncbi:hypothetical protein PR048_013518 [Dryococelus australis]|uniref:Uncharacterized protein n=1 Tax=Dryococelus australis TaxID=614101 RepID=A0ABQ9HTW6_9NEOP|nr:hypothetical protein PR048_013518 [Dryococelus australis]